MSLDWSLATWQSLVRATALVAAVLVAEHYLVILVGRLLQKRAGSIDGADGWGLPARANYAIGLVTDAGGLLLWAGLQGMTMTPLVAAVLLVAMGAAGGPDFLIHLCEENRACRQRAARERAEAVAREAEAQAVARELEQLRLLAARFPDLASELARWRLAGNKRHYTAALDLAEGLAGNLSEMRITLRALQAQTETLEREFASLADVGGRSGPGAAPARPRDRGRRAAGFEDLEI